MRPPSITSTSTSTFALLALLAAGGAPAREPPLRAPAASAPPAAEPPVPASPAPSFAPDAVRVGLVDSGVDYTLPLVRDALARRVGGTADGTILGIDFRDLDHRPFDAQDLGGGRVRRHGTRVASVLLAEAPGVALVPYRYPGQDMRLMHALVEHAAAHRVRVLGLPLGSDRPSQWEAFERAARAHPDMLFVASAGNDGRNLDERPLYPASLTLDNLLVVTSADDFGRPAPESGTGRRTVDYLVPAEAVPVTRFGGAPGVAAGSSYAVPRLVALAARLLAADPSLDAADLVREIRRRHGNGLRPADVGQGVVIDPQADAVGPIRTAPLDGAAGLAGALRAAAPATAAEIGSEGGSGGGSGGGAEGVAEGAITVPIELFALDPRWSDARAAAVAIEAAGILAPCGIALRPVRAERVGLDAADRLRDLEPGAAHTLFERVRRGGAERRASVVFARDTRMAEPYDAEAFGLGNTRDRPWLARSVWLTLALERAGEEHAGLALAHELWHVLANSGEHVDAPGNLMLARTTGGNRDLTPGQCERARAGARRQSLTVDR